MSKLRRVAHLAGAWTVAREGQNVSRQDLTIENGKVTGYRVRLAISFKYDTGD